MQHVAYLARLHEPSGLSVPLHELRGELSQSGLDRVHLVGMFAQGRAQPCHACSVEVGEDGPLGPVPDVPEARVLRTSPQASLVISLCKSMSSRTMCASVASPASAAAMRTSTLLKSALMIRMPGSATYMPRMPPPLACSTLVGRGTC